MAKKIQNSNNAKISEIVVTKDRNKMMEDIKKIEKTVNYGEIPLKTYEIMRNNFIGIK